jgi:hypothetical protein
MSFCRANLIAAALVAATLALAACGSDGSEPATTEPVNEPAVSTSSAPPRSQSPPPPAVYAAIANINPFGDACAGSEYEHVAEERVAELREAGFSSTIRPSGEFQEYYGGGYCVEAGRSKSRHRMETLVYRLEDNSIAAQILAVK